MKLSTRLAKIRKDLIEENCCFSDLMIALHELLKDLRKEEKGLVPIKVNFKTKWRRLK